MACNNRTASRSACLSGLHRNFDWTSWSFNRGERSSTEVCVFSRSLLTNAANSSLFRSCKQGRTAGDDSPRRRENHQLDGRVSSVSLRASDLVVYNLLRFKIDEDIDAIILQGEERTAELNSKYETFNFDDLNNFKSDSMLQWEGEDFKNGVCCHVSCIA